MPGDGDVSQVSTVKDHSARVCGEPESRPTKKFTSKELQQLNKPHNAHVAVRGKVYDVSSFVARHPGGMEQIMMGAGRDITQVFESYHHFHIYKTLEKFYVGELVNNELPVFPKQSGFYRVLKERVANYFKENNIDPKVDYWMFLRYVVFFMMVNIFWASMIILHESWVLLFLAAVGWGFFNALIAMTCFHDASHFAVSHKPWVWKLVATVHDLLQGTSVLVWMYQHVLGHHPYTNIDGADPDIITASEVPDIRRIKWDQKWIPRYFYQHIYAPMIYCFFVIKTRIQDIYILFTYKNANIRLNRPFLNQWVIFFLCKITHCVHRFIIPAYFMPWPQLILGNLVAEMCMGYWLALIFQTSHVVDKVDWPKPGKDNVINMDWAEMQVATTQDYATNSWFWTVFTGALNHQTTHHLFPGIIQSHYPKITPIIEQTCKDFGIKYHYVDSPKEAIGSHIEYLKKLGQSIARSDSDKKNQ